MKLYTPGPVPVPEAVMAAACRPVLHHHSEEFRQILQQTTRDLQSIFCTRQTVVMLSGSAMTGIESVAGCCIHPGDHVLVLSHGRFGDRLSECSASRGATVHTLNAPWGQSIDVEQLRQHLTLLLGTCRLKAVWMVHSETSTGVALDLQGLSAVIRELSPETFVLVDGVTSIAIQEVQTDAWKLDAVVTGAQKGLFAPPGLAIVSLSMRLEEYARGHSTGLYVNDMRRVLEVSDKGLMLWTPPVTIVSAVHAAARQVVRTGLETIWSEHADRREYVRHQAMLRGFELYGEGSSQALVILSHNRVNNIRTALRERFSMLVADGQDQLAGRVMRIGICGSYTIDSLAELFSAIDVILSDIGQAP
jgi:aspartate aminotransferase-like enzyme